MSRQTKKIAFCGVLGALAAAILLLGSMLGVGTYAAPALACLVFIPVIAEYGPKTALLLYGGTAVLGLLLAPDKELAAVFAFLGWYPAARAGFNRLRPGVLRILCKLLAFNAAGCAAYWGMMSVFGMEQVAAEWQAASAAMTALFAVMANAAFLLMDLALARLTRVYEIRLRPRLRRFL